jgi:hypothetical protein
MAATPSRIRLSALIHEHVLREGYDEEASFSFGLDLALDGLEARLAAAAP